MSSAETAVRAARDRARRLARLTVGWNVIEAVVAVASGVAAGSVALVGFGVDAGIEVGSAAVVLWRLDGDGPDRERRALRLIGAGFLALAAWITVESARDLLLGVAPEASPAGLAITALSLVVMPLLARAKRRAGRELGSAVVLADAAETRLCVLLSAVVLAGLALNAALGWWWADPLAALAVAGLAVAEGREALAG